MRFIFEQIRVGGDRNLAYLIGDRETGDAVAIDPAHAPQLVIDRAAAQGLRLQTVINTHGHTDHTAGNAYVKAHTNARIARYDAGDLPLYDGSELKVGAFALHILHTPGHTPDHIVIHQTEHKLLLTGDLLFVGKVGGTATPDQAKTEWRALQRLLRELPPATTVWPGHDYGCRPVSTLEMEAACNPFLQGDLAAFLQLKQTWSSFKTSHGLK